MPRIVDLSSSGWRAVVDDQGKITRMIDNEGDDVGLPMVNTNQLTGEMVQTIAVVTQAQYDALVTKDAKTLYIIKG